MKQVISTSIMLGAATLSGCSARQVSTADYSSKAASQPAGLAYALPTTMFCIDGLVMPPAAAQPAATPSSGATATATVSIAGAATKPGATPDGSAPATPSASICPAPAEPKPAKAGTEQGLQVTITAVRVPDPRTLLYAAPIDNAFDDQDTQISIGKNMLLSSAASAPQDETGAVIVNIAKTVEQIPRLDYVASTSVTPSTPPPTNFHREYTYSEIANAGDQGIVLLKNRLKIRFASGTLSNGLNVRPPADNTPPGSGTAQIACAHSLCFRPLRAVALALFDPTTPDDPGKTLDFIVPDQAAILGIDLTSAPFVKRQTKLTFADGVLTSISIKQPSVALAVSELPLDILKAVAGGAASAVPINVRYDSADIEKGMAAQGAAAEKPPATTSPQ
jgi:hypothetical protein